MAERPKDIFVIHSESAAPERELFGALHRVFAEGPLRVWSYEDWSWESFQRDRLRKRFTRGGLQVDPTRFMLGDPKPFVRAGKSPRVDLHTLRWILRSSSVVIFCEPTADAPSEGVELEFRELEKLLRGGGPDRPAVIQCLLSAGEWMLRFPSPIRQTDWRAAFRLGCAARAAGSDDLESFAKVLFIASYLTHVLHRLPKVFGAPLAHRLTAWACGQDSLLESAAGALQDEAYVRALQDAQGSADFDEEGARRRWQQLEDDLRSAEEYFLRLEESLRPGAWKIVYGPHFFTTDCHSFYAMTRRALGQFGERLNGALDAEIERQRRSETKASGDFVLGDFDERSLFRLTDDVNAFIAHFDRTWDEEVAERADFVFGWFGNNLPPESPAVVEDFLEWLGLTDPEASALAREFLLFAYVVLKRYRDDKNQPYYFNTFFGESLKQLCTVLREMKAPAALGTSPWRPSFQALRDEVHNCYLAAVREQPRL